MSRDKQIEEIAKIIMKPCFEIMEESGSTGRDCPFPYGCEECTAVNIYNAGYRKIYDDHQRQCTCYALGCQMAKRLEQKVAEEIFGEIEYLIWQNDTHPACELTEHIAELKKKYTEEK